MVRMKDIAREMGLAVSTVSKALNRSSEISEATVAAVWEKAAEMGYFSRRICDKRMKTIGVLLPEVRSHYYAEMMHALSRELEKEGYAMATLLTNQYTEDVQPYLAKLPQYDLDGMIVCCDHGFTAENYRALATGSIPVVMVAGINLIRAPNLKMPMRIRKIPARMVAIMRPAMPFSATIPATMAAKAAVGPEI